MRSLIPLLLLLGWPLGALAESTATPASRTAEDIRDCSQANLPGETMVQNMDMTATDSASGSEQRVRTRFYLKRYSETETRATLQVRAPIDLNGVSYLMIDKDENDRLYLYLPAIGRVRRVSGKQASDGMLGTDFSYEDIKQLRAVSSGGKVELIGERELEGRVAQELVLTPGADDESAYDRIEFLVDNDTCVPIRAKFFEPGARHVKTLEADTGSLEKIGDHWLARELKMTDHGKGTHTTMTLLDVEYDNRVSNAIFNQASFFLAATVGQRNRPSEGPLTLAWRGPLR